MYLATEDWQALVARLISRARLVVLTLSASAGTRWELTEAMRVLAPTRLLLIMPPVARNEYESIRTANLADLADVDAADRNPAWPNGTAPRLPDYEPEMAGPGTNAATSGIIRFTADWRPVYGKVRYPWATTATAGMTELHHVCEALRPALEELSAYESRTGRHYG